MSNNIHKVTSKVSYEDRCRLLGQKGIVLWLTGLSGSGKSTIAVEVEKKLIDLKKAACLLDGDNIRSGLNSDLGFSDEDRMENIRRVVEVAKLFRESGMATIVSFITPFEESRKFARKIIGDNFYFEIYVKASLDTCLKRDPNGLYAKALNNNISQFTGISSNYEEPENPDLIIDTEKLSVEESIEKLLKFVLEKIKI